MRPSLDGDQFAEIVYEKIVQISFKQYNFNPLTAVSRLIGLGHSADSGKWRQINLFPSHGVKCIL